MSRGLAPWRELQGGNTPLPKKILHFALCIIAGPFQFEITKTYDLISGGCKGGGSSSYHKRYCISENHKWTSFLSRFIQFVVLQRAFLRKCCIW